MEINCFNEHCIEKHTWGSFPCTYENCKFASYSQHCFKLHRQSHIYEQKEKLLPVTCNRKNCGRRFKNDFDLNNHLQGGIPFSSRINIFIDNLKYLNFLLITVCLFFVEKLKYGWGEFLYELGGILLAIP